MPEVTTFSNAKFKCKPEQLDIIDCLFQDQLELGVIERIPNLETSLHENPNGSLLFYMPVCKLSNETTKVRAVYLSNLYEDKDNSISHNQTICSGSNLYRKLSTVVNQLKFDKYLCFDIVNPFLQIAIPEVYHWVIYGGLW